jgi:hypothetical protein
MNPDAAPGEARGAPLDLEQFAGFTPGPWIALHKPGGFVIRPRFGPALEICMGRDSAWKDANSALLLAAPALLEECRRQRAEIARLRGVLQELTTPHGRYSRDRLTHAHNTIEDMAATARAALQQTGEGA